MPLLKKTLDVLNGIYTNINDTAGIDTPSWSSPGAWTSNASSGLPPNSMVDCRNIICTRDQKVVARPPLLTSWDFTSTYGSSAGYVVTGLYALPNSTTNSLLYTWANSTTANIGNFQTNTQYNQSSVENIIGGSVSSTFTGLQNLLPDYSWNLTTFPTISFNTTRFISSNSNVYVCGSNGVFRSTETYLRDITASSYNSFKKVINPIVKQLSAQITASPSAQNRWFSAGNLVQIQIVVTEQLSQSQIYQGKPSRLLTVNNIGTLSSIQLSFSVDNTNLFLNGAGVTVYRTIQYSPSSAAPTNYYACYEASLSSGTTVGNTTTFTNIELTLNDSSITAFQEIYTSLNRESAQSPISGVTLSAESSTAPVAQDVAVYKGYTAYGNIMTVPFTTLTYTNLPTNDGLDQLQVGATTISLPVISNSTTPPANTGVIDLTTGSYEGINSSPNSGNGYTLVLRPQNPSASSSAAQYCVPYYATASTIVKAGGTGTTWNLNITPSSTAPFDITTFPTTGIVAVVTGASATGAIMALFSYQSYTQITASGYYTFNDCVAYGIPFSDTNYTTLASAGTFFMFPLSGSSVSALPVYAIGSNATGYGGVVGFSLIPTYEEFPTRPFNSTIIGTVTNIGSSGAGGFITGAISFNGVYAQTSAQLLDSTTRATVDLYNSSKLNEDPYFIYDTSATAPVGRIRIESLYAGYSRLSPYSNSSSTSGTGYYDEIKARVFRASGTPQATFSEPITATYTNIMQQSVQVAAGLSFSKYNKPEEIAVDQIFTPQIVGDPLKPIIKMVSLYDRLLIFKQDEGTFRIDVEGAGSGILPVVSSNLQVDNTTWLLLPESVQVLEGQVIYFSTLGFTSLSPSITISNIGTSIATETLQNFAIIKNNGGINKVRSFVIPQQRLYGCTFPNVNPDNTSRTYVFNAANGNWTNWDGEYEQITVSARGQMSVTTPIYNPASTIVTESDIDTTSLNLNSINWTVLRQADFEAPQSNQIEDVMPLTGMTITESIPSSAITISGFTSSGVYKNLYNNLLLFKNRDIWYQFANGGVYKTQLTNTVVGTSITLTFVDAYGNSLISIPYTPSTSDSIITAVNSEILLNKYYTSTPRGTTLSHFNEVHLYGEEGLQLSNFNIGFKSSDVLNTEIIDLNGDFVLSLAGDYLTTVNSTPESQFSPYFVLNIDSYPFRFLVPRTAARGRYLQMALLHNTPNEVFSINSLAYMYRDTGSIKIKTHVSS
jgi:hypothetical protein